MMEDKVKEKILENLNYWKDGNLTTEDLLKEILDLIDLEGKEEDKDEEMAMAGKGGKYKRKFSKSKVDEDQEEEDNQDDTEEQEEEMSKYIEKEFFLFGDKILNSEKFNNLNTNVLVEDIKKFKPDIYIDHQENISDKVFIKEIYNKNDNWYLKLIGDKDILEKFNHLSPSIVKSGDVITVNEISLTNNPKLPQTDLVDVSKFSFEWSLLPSNLQKYILRFNDFTTLKVLNKRAKDKIMFDETIEIKDIKERLINSIVSEYKKD